MGASTSIRRTWIWDFVKVVEKRRENHDAGEVNGSEPVEDDEDVLVRESLEAKVETG
jgi:hypothetical protein